MRIGASTYYSLISKSIIDCVNELEKIGFTDIELLYEYNHFFTDEEISLLKRKKLSFSMHCPFMLSGLNYPNYDSVASLINLIEKSLDTAARIGCTYCIMHGGRIPAPYLKIERSKNRNFFINLFIERFDYIFKKYSRSGLKIILENLPNDDLIGGRPSDIIKIQKAIPELGFCFDIAHSTVLNQTDEIIDKLKIDYVHATDNNLELDEHMVIGEGKINFKKIFRKLKNKGFDGKIILENLSFKDCKKSLKNLEKIINSL